jgi:hypothetical protein
MYRITRRVNALRGTISWWLQGPFVNQIEDTGDTTAPTLSGWRYRLWQAGVWLYH